MEEQNRTRLWLRWVGANAIGEVFGLGGTFALLFAVLQPALNASGVTGVAGILLNFVAAVFSGVLEATIVGLLQWGAMHSWFPRLRARSWWFGTLWGALAAYVLGYLPSTLMDMGAQAGSAPAQEPPQWLTLLLAAGLGLVAGAVLSFAQWRVLRRHAVRAGRWIPANMLAWAAGMPLIFAGMHIAFGGSNRPFVLIILVTLLLAGSVVGAIHGWFLIMTKPERSEEQ